MSDYRTLGPDDVIQEWDERTSLIIDGWKPVTPDNLGKTPARYKMHQFRRPIKSETAEPPTNLQQSIKVLGDRQRTSLTIEDARERRVCRICQIDGKNAEPGNPFVLNFGEEYAHRKCIEAHPELPPIHRVVDAAELDRLRAELVDANEQLKAEQRLSDSNGKACLNLRRQIVALYQRVDVQEVAKLKKEVAAANKGAERTYRINRGLERKLLDLRKRVKELEGEVEFLRKRKTVPQTLKS